MRRTIPYSVLPLSLIACAIACSPWLRAFPSSVIAVPLFGAALLSVIIPLIVVGVGARRLLISAIIDTVLFVFYELLVTLRSPGNFAGLWTGLVHGPSQILTFALPLVSPRTLLVAPVALCWLAGAILGECVARGWHSMVPYAVLLVSFGLAYAGTVRGITNAADGRRYDTLLAAALLVTLLLLRAAQTWIAQERSASATQQDGRLPLRGLRIGAIAAVVITLAAAGAVQSNAFTGQPTTPARVPPVNVSQPLSPVSFISGLRPTDPNSKGTALFTVTFDRATTNYVSIASVDSYDGSGWTFNRTFRPSGGVIPAEDDPTLRPTTAPVTQQYTIDAGPMTTGPWMPYLHRATRVNGLAVNIDPTSGMIVPANRLVAGTSYTVQSSTAQKVFNDLPATAVPALSGDATDLLLPDAVNGQLTTLISALEIETGVSSSQPVAFLKAVADQFRKDSLSGGPVTSASPSPTSSPAPTTPPASSLTRSPANPSTRSSAQRRPTTPRSVAKSPSAHRFVEPVQAAATRTAGRPRNAKTPTPRSRARTSPAARTSTTRAVSSAPPASPTPTATGRPEAGGNGFADVLASIGQYRSATPEQYATLMTLIARKINVRARLVTGFRITPPSGSSALPRGRYTVTTSEAWSWVEIPISNVGWVVLDPSPPPGSYANKPLGKSSARPPQSPTATPTNSVEITKPNAASVAAAPPGKPPRPHHTSVLTVVAIVLVSAAALLIALALILLLRKRVRSRRRRSSGDPRRRLVGAWQESLDVLVESGLPDLDTFTSAEVSKATSEQFGGESGEQARYLGDAANAAIFAPTSWIGPAEADAAWRAHAVLRRSVRRRLGWRARLGASLRYHRHPRTRALVGPASWETATRQNRAEGRPRGGRHSTGRRAH